LPAEAGSDQRSGVRDQKNRTADTDRLLSREVQEVRDSNKGDEGDRRFLIGVPRNAEKD
jgi:hypothetical protein